MLVTIRAVQAGFPRHASWLGRLLNGLLIATLLIFSGCAALPPPVPREPTQALPASQNELLGRIAAQSLAAQGMAAGSAAAGSSGFRPLPVSSFAMDARLTLARSAQKSLDLQYYLLQNDTTGHALVRAVRDAAQRGVRVRLLVDDLYTADNDKMLQALAAFPNIEIRLFNPFPAGRAYAFTRWLFALGDFARINHRMHNKLFIADGAFAIAGGRNIADEYFFTSKDGNFVDFDLLLAGDAVPRLAATFDSYWNSPRIFPLHTIAPPRASPEALRDEFEQLTADALNSYPPLPPTAPDLLGYTPLSADLQHPPLRLLYGSIDVFADDPEKVSGRSESGTDTTTVTARAGMAMAEAQHEVVIGSPYFIPGQLGMAGLRRARENGVRVAVITNSLASNDEPFASAAYGRYRVAMLKLGAELYETDSSQLKHDVDFSAALRSSVGRSHSKLIVIDRRTTFVGSMNMDFRSSRVNTELGMLVHSPELAKIVLALGDRVNSVGSYKLRLDPSGEHVQWISVNKGVETVYDSEPGVDFGTRLKLLLLFPFIAESLL